MILNHFVASIYYITLYYVLTHMETLISYLDFFINQSHYAVIELKTLIRTYNHQVKWLEDWVTLSNINPIIQ